MHPFLTAFFRPRIVPRARATSKHSVCKNVRNASPAARVYSSRQLDTWTRGVTVAVLYPRASSRIAPVPTDVSSVSTVSAVVGVDSRGCLAGGGAPPVASLLPSPGSSGGAVGAVGAVGAGGAGGAGDASESSAGGRRGGGGCSAMRRSRAAIQPPPLPSPLLPPPPLPPPPPPLQPPSSAPLSAPPGTERTSRYLASSRTRRAASVALSGTQRHSATLSGTQWHSAALSGTQRQSSVISPGELAHGRIAVA